MRRLLLTAALLGLFTPTLVVLPVAAVPAPHLPHAVAPGLRSLDVVDGAVTAARFDTVGASWDRGATGTVQVRTRSGRTWSPWQPLDATDGGPDAGSRDARYASGRTVSEPLFAGVADAVQLRAVHGRVSGLRATLVDSGASAFDADPSGTVSGPGVARASTPQPAIYSRAQWGADESLRSLHAGCSVPDYSDTIKVGFVHHTDTPNDYSASQVPSIIRGIYAYHVTSNGWCDIGYNFLVDRFGRTWEGRYGGTTRPVIGAHTGGFNTNSFAAAMIGTYASVQAPAASIAALTRLFAWKLGRAFADPTSTATLTSAGGPNTPYAAGVAHTFTVLSGHRDAGYTTCPGNALYTQLGAVRSSVRSAIGPGFVLPVASARSRAYGGPVVTVSTRVITPLSWRLDVRRATDGVVVRSVTGTASTTLSAVFDLKAATGAPLPPSGYRLYLSGSSGTSKAVTWNAPFDITTTAGSPPPPGTPATPIPARYTPLSPFRVLDTRTGLGSADGPHRLLRDGRVEVKVLGVGGVPSSGVAAVAVNLTAISSDGPDYLSAYATDSPYQRLGNVQTRTGDSRTALVVTRVGTDGHVSVVNGPRPAYAALDVVGYFPTTGGSSYTPLRPVRVLDTRAKKTPLAGAQVRLVQVAGVGGVPADATGVVANVTVVQPKLKGYLMAYPAGSTRPGAASVSFGAGQVVANRVMSALGSGKLALWPRFGPVDVAVDVVGYYRPGGGRTYAALLEHVRLLDTRAAIGVPTHTLAPAGSTTKVQLAGRGGVPADATAVALVLTTNGALVGGHVVTWSGSGPVPYASDVNEVPGLVDANLVVVQLGSGRMSVFSSQASHLYADVVGYWR